MQSPEIVRAWIKSFEEGDLESLDAFTAHDFTYDHRLGPRPMAKWEYLDLVGALRVAFPDWSFNAAPLHLKAGRVHAEVHVTGTHRAELDLTSLGLPKVAPTGRRLELPPEEAFWDVRGSKVTGFEVQATPGGGLPGVLDALGVTVDADVLTPRSIA